jgi:hypothetical protein
MEFYCIQLVNALLLLHIMKIKRFEVLYGMIIIDRNTHKLRRRIFLNVSVLYPGLRFDMLFITMLLIDVVKVLFVILTFIKGLLIPHLPKNRNHGAALTSRDVHTESSDSFYRRKYE